MKYLYYLTIIILLNFNCNFALAQETALAELRLNPDIASFLDPEYFTIQINGNSNVNAINMAEIKLQFDTKNLIFDSIDYSEDFCEFNIFENINNQAGKINFVCATTNASTTLNIAKIKFKKINSGFSKISLGDSRFFLNNGLGESILPVAGSYNFYIYK